MSDFIKRLHEERLRTWEQAKALLDTAANEKRDLSAEEEATYGAMNARMDEIDARVTEVRDAHERAKASDEAFAALLAKPAAKPEQAERATDESAALRSFLRGEGKRSYDVRPNGPVDFRTLSKLSAGAGLNTVKTSFYDRLIAHLIEVSGVLATGPTVLSTATGESIQVPKTTAHSASASIVAEAGTIAANDPTFGQVTLDAFKYAFLLQVSHELLNDTSVDLMGYLAMQAGRALGNGFGAHLVTGSGTAQPNGVVTAATSGVTGGTGVVGAFTGDNLIDLFYSVIAPYRNSASCAWLMKDSTVATARKIKDTTNQYIWQPGLQAGSPDMLLGKPLYTDPNVAAVALNAKSVVFGDFSQYFVRQIENIRFERSDDFAFNTDLVTFRAILRGDGDLIDTTGAIKYFTGAAS
jgi:HK97 family phage major capsid protein